MGRVFLCRFDGLTVREKNTLTERVGGLGFLPPTLDDRGRLVPPKGAEGGGFFVIPFEGVRGIPPEGFRHSIF